MFDEGQCGQLDVTDLINNSSFGVQNQPIKVDIFSF